jgi:iron complex transport system ATP-binding protein
MLRANKISWIVDGQSLVRDASLELRTGEITAILGPNGAGKSTLLRMLARDLSPTTGDIALNGKALQSWDAAALARQRAVLPQTESLRFGFRVREVVSLGRHPWAGRRSGAETRIVDEAMRAVGVTALADRPYPGLSMGERARVQLARVLAQVWETSDQGPRFLLLDEPTASLDLAHQHEVLALLRRFAATGVGIGVVMHDLNLALEYTDRAALMQNGAVDSWAATSEVLNRDAIQRVFGVKVELLARPGERRPWIATTLFRASTDPGT